MTNATPPATQDRFLDLLLAAIYAIVGALEPVIMTIAHTPDRPWVERIRIGNRFWAIIRELLALTLRIKPEILSTNPVFPPTRPLDLTPRQLAKRLAFLLHQLECLAAEANAALTTAFHHHANIIRAIAGCDCLPPQTWERAG